MWNRAAGAGRGRWVVASLAAVAVLAVTACSGDDDGDAAATTTTAAEVTTTAPDDNGDTDTDTDTDEAGESTTTSSRPEGALTDNSIRLLGDTLGITGSCAGRAEDSRVEYRYELTNGGSLVLTLATGRPADVVYEGFSGTFAATGAFVGVASTGDGFVTGTATLSGASPTNEGRTTELEYRATVPLRNCADVTTTTSAG